MKNNCKCPVCGEKAHIILDQFWYFQCDECSTTIGKFFHGVVLNSDKTYTIISIGKWKTLKEAKKAINGYAFKTKGE